MDSDNLLTSSLTDRMQSIQTSSNEVLKRKPVGTAVGTDEDVVVDIVEGDAVDEPALFKETRVVVWCGVMWGIA